MGFGSGELAVKDEGYELKDGDGSSQRRNLGWMEQRPASRVLDLGCSYGSLAALLSGLGHEVVGVDLEELKDVREQIGGPHVRTQVTNAHTVCRLRVENIHQEQH